MRKLIIVLAVLAAVLALPGAALADHPGETLTGATPAGAGVAANQGGEGATWEWLASFPTGNPHTDLDFFTQGGAMYASVGTLATSVNGGGQNIIQLTDENGELALANVSNHPSAACPSLASGVTGLQHDVEATPKGDVIFNTDWGGLASTEDAQLLLDSSDAPGRCHDNGSLGIPGTGAPQGGLEIIDITDVANPVEIALTSHIGESHTVNVDPKRPHIAYSVTSDATTVDLNGTPDDYSDDTRQNEESGLAHDGFEIVDLSSCMNFPEDATLEQKRGVDPESGEFLEGEGCRPTVYRYRWPSIAQTVGHTERDALYACHELEVYPNDLLTCGSGQALIVFDMSKVFDDNGTPDDFTDDTPKGDPLPCRVRASTSSATPTGAPVIDCVVGQDEADLSISGWLDMGAPSLEGVQLLGEVHHQGRDNENEELPAYASAEDIDFNHEAEFTNSRQFVIATDERGGGVVPPDASCDPAGANSFGNGGIHAYKVSELDQTVPVVRDEAGNVDQQATAEEAWDAYARTPDGEKAVFRATPRIPAGSFCTAHVFHQIPGQNRVFMAWYSQGTQVVDYVEHLDGSFEWKEAGWWMPENTNQWTSAIFKYEENEDGTFTYYGVASDFNLGEKGRNEIDVYSVTLPPPPTPVLNGEGPDSACDDTAVPDPGFGDIAGNTHEANIACIAWYDITKGLTDNRYGPGEDVRRDQMASFMARLATEAGLTLPEDPPDAFDDDNGNTHENNINALAALDLIAGRGDIDGDGNDEFEPAQPVRRDQMASFIARVHEAVSGLPQDPSDAFDDDDGNTHEDNINALAALDVVEGRPDSNDVDGDGDTDEHIYAPGENVRRDQMGSFIARDLAALEGTDTVYRGGANVVLGAQPTEETPTVTGRVDAHKDVQELTADGCGLSGESLTVAEDGTFEVDLSGRSGNCELSLTVTTTRGEADDGQSVTYLFAIEGSGGEEATAAGRSRAS